MLGLFLAGCLHRNKFRNNWIGHYFTIACHLVTPSQMMWKFSDQSKLEYYMMCLPKHKIIQPWKVYEKKNNDPTNYSTRSYATCSKSFGWSNQDTFNNLVDSGPGKGKPSPTYVSGIFHTSSWKKATRSSSLVRSNKGERFVERPRNGKVQEKRLVFSPRLRQSKPKGLIGTLDIRQFWQILPETLHWILDTK